MASANNLIQISPNLVIYRNSSKIGSIYFRRNKKSAFLGGMYFDVNHKYYMWYDKNLSTNQFIDIILGPYIQELKSCLI